jgi:hypothetical protein
VVVCSLEAPLDFRNCVVETAPDVVQTNFFWNARPTALTTIIRGYGAHWSWEVLLEAPFDLRNGIVKAASWSSKTDISRNTRPATFLALLRFDDANRRNKLLLLEAPFHFRN